MVGYTGTFYSSKGLSTGSPARFAYAVLAASQVVAFANAVRFSYDDRYLGGKTVIHWHTGENVDSAVWISICLVVIVIINLLPVIVSVVKYIVRHRLRPS